MLFSLLIWCATLLVADSVVWWSDNLQFYNLYFSPFEWNSQRIFSLVANLITPLQVFSECHAFLPLTLVIFHSRFGFEWITKPNLAKPNEMKWNETKSTTSSTHHIELKFAKTQEHNKLWPFVFGGGNGDEATGTILVVCCCLSTCLNVFVWITYNTIKV